MSSLGLASKKKAVNYKQLLLPRATLDLLFSCWWAVVFLEASGRPLIMCQCPEVAHDCFLKDGWEDGSLAFLPVWGRRGRASLPCLLGKVPCSPGALCCARLHRKYGRYRLFRRQIMLSWKINVGMRDAA